MVEKGHRPYGTEPEDLEAEAALQEASAIEREADDLLAASAITRTEYTERLGDAARLRRTAGRSADEGLRFESLRSDLFAEKAVRLIADDQVENPAYGPAAPDSKRGPYLDTRLRNETLHKVLRRLMLTKGRGKERGGFISYAQLGINQLGAVYEGLMSYTGFIAVEDLYEVAKGGDASGGSWMIPESKVHEYEDDVFVQRVRDETTGHLERVVHREGSFVYRLAGRDRQTSASYYTPKSLTEVTVELALKHRLDQDGTTTRARELLEWKICEPALGSGAFLNEAIDQVAAEYLRRREGELGRRIDTERRQIELQKTKAYVALHNAYGVDLNATAVELAEVSLWLNTMHPGMRAPWFGLHLRRGNSLIGAGRKVYRGKDLHKGAWLAKKDALSPDELPFRDGDLPEGAVHHFLLPAVGWGAVAAEPEARKLAPDQASALAAWRKGIQKSPKGTAFAEREDEPAADRAKRYVTWQKRNRDSEAGRLQRLARTTEFLWRMVAKRLELSEDKIARRIDVWGADWFDQPDQGADRQRVLDDLTAIGTPYWRLKKVMDAWCALWFWPLDKVAELDGTARAYEVGGGVVSEADLAALLGGAPGPRAAEATAPEPTDGPAPGDQGWEKVSLFGEPVEEEQQRSSSGQRRGGSRQSRIPTNRWRDTIPLRTLADWLDFLDCLLGTHEVPEGSFLDAIEDLDVLTTYEKDLVAVLGMDEAQHLTGRFPWLGVVESIAGSTEKDIQAEDGHGFFHWELHFAHVFRGKSGGFDLQVGNPPWVRPRWEENPILAEHEPWFMLTEKPARAERTRRTDELLASDTVRRTLLSELASHGGTVAMLGSEQMYPLLKGTQPDLYRAFMCTTWTHTGHEGTVGLVHPDSHFSGDKEASLREAAYERLLIHGDFVNSGNRFFPPPVGRSSHFGVHIYGRAGEIGFDHLSWLFSVDALRLSADDDGTAPDPGVRFGSSWDERPHRKRIVRVTEETLAEWQRLTGDEDQPVRQARLLSPVSTAEAQAIRALADYPVRLGSEPQITRGYDESGAKADGLIDYNLPDESGERHLPADWSEVILKGPQIGLANPMFKQPSQGGGEVLGLNPQTIADDAVPESEYVYVAEESVYKGLQDRWIDHRRLADLRASETAVGYARTAVAESRLVAEDKVTDAEVDAWMQEWARRPYTEFYRVAWREFIAPDTERSLYAALVPPGGTHIHAVRSAALSSNRPTVLSAGFWSGIPIDYLLRTTRVRHLDVTPARRLPIPAEEHPLASALLLRTLRLNCLTSAYAGLWQELYDPTWTAYEPWAVPHQNLQSLHSVTPTWNRDTPLRTERARRMALVEIDALVAVWLGVSADALAAMYKARFPIMQDFDAVTWFDANERKIAGDRYTFGFGQTKDHYEQLLAFNGGERSEPPEGYAAPFYKADREAEMRYAHAYFTQRMNDA